MHAGQAKGASQEFFKLPFFAVVGASNDRTKFGNRVLRHYADNGKKCVPINKKTKEIEGITSIDSLSRLKKLIDEKEIPTVANCQDVGISIITPPGVTKVILEEGRSLGFKNFFLQPGTVDDAVQEYISSSLSDCRVIQSCVLVDLPPI